MAETNGVPIPNMPLDQARTLLVTLGPNGQVNAFFPPDEIIGRFLHSKLGSMLDEFYRKQHAAKRVVVPDIRLSS